MRRFETLNAQHGNLSVDYEEDEYTDSEDESDDGSAA
eukprot:COSAG04_NODE_4_length_52282_cov_12.667133_41_plen_37_part_00